MNNSENFLRLYFTNHVRACLNGFNELANAPMATTMTLIVIAIAIALPVLLYLLLQNIQGLSHHWQQQTISLYLKNSISQPDLMQLKNQLQNNPEITSVDYVSPEQGLIEFSKLAHMNNSLRELPDNPLPPVLVIHPTERGQSPDHIQPLFNSVKNLPNVEQAQLDMAWVKRLYYLLTIGQRFMITLVILFGLGVILIVGNTIRLTTHHYRQEMLVLRLIGASSAFIRRPLLYRGWLYGLLGGSLAILFVSLILWWLSNPSELLAQTYHSTWVLNELPNHTAAIILGIASLLGWLGSWIAVERYLHTPERY